jgi:hypothetical protein
MENFELFNPWLIDEVSEHDYMFWTDNIIIKENINQSKYWYNQSLQTRTRNACVLYANCWAVSDLTWYKFSESELLEIVDLAEKSYGWRETMWMTFHKWADCVRTWWNNKFKDNQLITFRLQIWDEKFYEALEKWHTLTVWYKTSRDYLIDSQEDWEIQWEDFLKNWGHLVRLYKKWDNFRIIDNYDWKKIYNDYINNKIEKLQKNGVYFISAYLYLYNNDYMSDQIKDNMSLENAKKFFDRWYTSWLNPKNPMTREEMWATLEVILSKNNLK